MMKHVEHLQLEGYERIFVGRTHTPKIIFLMKLKKKLNSVAFVREQTMPTERPPLDGEVSANFCG
jgi:hypothetical protein